MIEELAPISSQIKKHHLEMKNLFLLLWLVPILGAEAQENPAMKYQVFIDLTQVVDDKVVDINVPGLMELMQDDTGGFYPILLELRPDMNAYLKANPGIGVESVAGIINSESLKDDEIRGFFQLAIKAEPGETFEYLAIQAKRQRIRQAVVVAMAEAGVDALVYPTIRQKPAKIGETQSGTNCHLSGNIDFPAISVPAGFTDDGLPVGIEFMARKWQEAYLLRLAYAYEQASLHRRMPASTPAL